MRTESDLPSIDDVIGRIHREIENRRARTTGPAPHEDVLSSDGNPRSNVRLQPDFTPRGGDSYALHELLDFHDVDFVTNAFRAVLGRWPDPVGLRHYVELLRRGAASKVDILGRIRWSREGRRRQVRVRGLMPRFAAERLLSLPMIGWGLRWVTVLAGLPRVTLSQRRFEAHAMFRDEALADSVRILDEQISRFLGSLRNQERSLDELRRVADDERRAREALGGIATARHDDLAAEIRGYGQASESLADDMRQIEAGLAREMNAREELGGFATMRMDELAAEMRGHRQAEDSLRNDLQRIEDGLAREMTAREELGGIATARLEDLSTDLDRVIAELKHTTARETERLDAGLAVQNRAVRELGGKAIEIRQELDRVAARFSEVDQAFFDQTRATRDLANQIEERQDRKDRTLSQVRHEVVQQTRRLDLLLEEARRRLPDPFTHDQLRVFKNAADHRLDALYVSLEDELRGPRGMVKTRLEPYLTFVREAGVGTDKWPVLDLGCGRGEWLELLREHDLIGRGVDFNTALIDACRERGLEVHEGDLLEYLRELPSSSLGAVTGFHVIEHLPLQGLIDTLTEVARVLKPGGLAIFETPNCGNLLVGSHTFYLDPTHRNPLPSLLMRFLLEARGLSRVEVLEMNPSEDLPALPGDDALTRRFNEFFCSARDYAVVGYRP